MTCWRERSRPATLPRGCIVRADVRRVDYDDGTGRFEEEVRWHDSYEAKQHVHHYGKSVAPVCWSLVGYSSGFVSACLGKEIYFREVSCAGQRQRHCSAAGRDVNSWGAEGESIRAEFQAGSHAHETGTSGVCGDAWPARHSVPSAATVGC